MGFQDAAILSSQFISFPHFLEIVEEVMVSVLSYFF